MCALLSGPKISSASAVILPFNGAFWKSSPFIHWNHMLTKINLNANKFHVPSMFCVCHLVCLDQPFWKAPLWLWLESWPDYLASMKFNLWFSLYCCVCRVFWVWRYLLRRKSVWFGLVLFLFMIPPLWPLLAQIVDIRTSPFILGINASLAEHKK